MGLHVGLLSRTGHPCLIQSTMATSSPILGGVRADQVEAPELPALVGDEMDLDRGHNGGPDQVEEPVVPAFVEDDMDLDQGGEFSVERFLEERFLRGR